MSFFLKAILGDSKLHVWISYFFFKVHLTHGDLQNGF